MFHINHINLNFCIMKKNLFFSLMIGAALLVASCKDDPELNLPAAAGAISGLDANTCPVKTVNLSVGNIDGAISYQWYKNGAEITGATSQTYEATATATYTVAGVNNDGVGEHSPGKDVTITQCNAPATAGNIKGASLNECGVLNVRLSIAPIDGATSYQWYKDNTAIPSATDTVYIVTQNGSYTVEGVNINGPGAKSPAKAVSISDCVTINGKDVNACGEATVALSVTIPNAVSYKWYKNGEALPGATNSSYSATTSGTYSVEGIDAQGNVCGQGRGKVVNIYTACRTDIVGNYTLTTIPFRVSGNPPQVVIEGDTLANGFPTTPATITISIDEDNPNGVIIEGDIPPVYNEEEKTGVLKATFNRADNSLSIAFPQTIGEFPQGWVGIVYPAYFEGGIFKYYDRTLTKPATLSYNATTKVFTMDIGYNTWAVEKDMFIPTGNVKPGTFKLTRNP